MYHLEENLHTFLLTSLWAVVWLVVPLARLTDPYLRRDLATTPEDPVDYLKGKLWIPAFVGAVPSALLALFVSIEILGSEPHMSLLSLSEALPFVFSIYLFPAIVPILIQVCAAWSLLLVGAVRRFEMNERMGTWQYGAYTFILSVALCALWQFFIEMAIWGRRPPRTYPRSLPMFLICLTVSIAAIRIVCSQWRRVKDEFLNLDPDAPT